MPVRFHFHISQLTSKLALQKIMNNLRLLLFFFVLLAPLQLTSARHVKGSWVAEANSCFSECQAKGGWTDDVTTKQILEDPEKWKCVMLFENFTRCIDGGNPKNPPLSDCKCE